MAFLNQYSLLVALVIGAGLVAWGLWHWRRPRPIVRVALLLAYIIAAALIVLAARYPAPTADTVAEVDAALANGRPTVIMFYSNY